MDSVLRACGFSDEMREYLMQEELRIETIRDEIIAAAPISLCLKLRLIHDKKTCKDITDAKELLFMGGDELKTVLYLFDEWYDTEVYIKKSAPVGMFGTVDQVYDYIEKDDDGTCFRLELWEQECESEAYIHRYDYYFYDGDICWFRKLRAVSYEGENVSYYPKTNRYLTGESDLDLPLPYQPGDIVLIDCRPFAPSFHALVVEGQKQIDCCLPQILFLTPFTEDEWRLEALKHRRFCKELEGGSYMPELSPLYRIRRINEDEMDADGDSFLKKLSSSFAGDEEAGEQFWKLWHEDETYTKTMEQVEKIWEKTIR